MAGIVVETGMPGAVEREAFGAVDQFFSEGNGPARC